MTPRVIFVLPGFMAGGAERVLIALAARLDRSRFSSRLVVLDGAGPLAAEVPDHVPVQVIGGKRLRTAIFGLARHLRRLDPDIVITTLPHLNIGLLLMRPVLPRGVRILIREANLPSRNLRAMPLLRWAIRRFYRRADRVLCNADAVARELIDDFGVPEKLVFRLANPVDVAGIRKQAAPARRHPGAGLRFVAAGRLTAQKGFDRLIDMWPSLPASARLTILGDGPDRDALASRAAALGLADRVHLPGFEPRPWPFFAGADAFVLPSRWEGLPNVVLEALACGTRVIAAPEAGGVREIAAAAPPGAVTLAEPGAEFIAALRAVRPHPPRRARPSLLPPEYHAAAVVARLDSLLAEL